MTKVELIDIMNNEKKSVFFNNNKVFGIRGDSQKYKVRDSVNESYSIYENEKYETLNSTCAIYFDKNSDLEKIIKDAKHFGSNIYLLCGDNWGDGEDTYINEIKIKDAEVLAIL